MRRTEGPTHIKTAARIECGRIVKSANTPTAIRMPGALPPQGIDMRPGILYLFLFTQSLCKIPQAQARASRCWPSTGWWWKLEKDCLKRCIHFQRSAHMMLIVFCLVGIFQPTTTPLRHTLYGSSFSQPSQTTHTLARAHIHTHVCTHVRARAQSLMAWFVCSARCVFGMHVRFCILFMLLGLFEFPFNAFDNMGVCGCGCGCVRGCSLARVGANEKTRLTARAMLCARACLFVCVFFFCV